MKALNFIIIKLAICLALGILLSHSLSIDLRYIVYAVVLTFIGLIITFTIAKRQFKKTIWFGLFVYVFTIGLGGLTYSLHDQSKFKQHYSQFLTSDNTQPPIITLRIRERLKPSLYHDKYVIDLLKINNQTVSGKLLLNVSTDSLKVSFKVDDILMVSSEFSEIRKPLNPNQFDYNAYLQKQYILHQVFAEPPTILTLSSETHTLLGYSAALRDRINFELKTYSFKLEELAIINALILGQRQDMSKDIYNSYVNAGAIHILAVSGLHVGILLLLLNFSLEPIAYLKHGKLIKVCLIIVLLWSFAIIAGLSASVTRAVTMFSIVAIAMNWKRPTNIYNTLAISIFVLLLFKPMFLFDVGFQMSYLAVLAIVTVQPLLYKLWKPKWKVIDYFWQIFTVTLAAQLGVVPISLYYFHQFPGLFFVSNLAIIPFLGLILGLGIVVITLALLHCLPELLANMYGSIISMMNAVIAWVSQQESFILQHISFDIEHVLMSYLLIITSIWLYRKRDFSRLSLFLISILCAQGVWFYSTYKQANTSFIVFHKSRYSLLGHQVNSELNVFHNFDSITYARDKVISNYSVGNFIGSITKDSLTSVYQFRDNTILVIDSLGVYNVQSFQPDYVLLRNSPRINLERMIDSIHPKYIIADGSNYKTYIKRWESTCKKRKLPFHHTGKKGAFILKE